MKFKPVWKTNKIVLPQHSDHAGVMWHGNYFNWLEESRINALSEVDVNYFELTKNGFELDKKYIKIIGFRSIKKVGKYIANIRLHRDVNVDFNFEVIAS